MVCYYNKACARDNLSLMTTQLLYARPQLFIHRRGVERGEENMLVSPSRSPDGYCRIRAFVTRPAGKLKILARIDPSVGKRYVLSAYATLF